MVSIFSHAARLKGVVAAATSSATRDLVDDRGRALDSSSSDLGQKVEHDAKLRYPVLLLGLVTQTQHQISPEVTVQ